MKYKEKIVNQNFLDGHKKVYNGIWIVISIPVLLPIFLLELIYKLGQLAEKIESSIVRILTKIRDFIFVVIYWKQLPTFQEKYGMSRKEFYEED